MKDEMGGKVIVEFVGLGSKMYSLVTVDDKKLVRAKGYLWVFVGIGGYWWVLVGICGYLWVFVGICGYLWVFAGICDLKLMVVGFF